MAKPTPPTITVEDQQEIQVGGLNKGQEYNDNVGRSNRGLRAVIDAFRTYAGRPVIRTINNSEPDEAGNYVIPTTVVAQALTTTQRDALTGAELILGRLIYNTTVGRLQVYGNSGWADTAPAAKTTTFAYLPSGLLSTVIETNAAAVQLRKTEFSYTSGVLVQVIETAGSATRTTAFTYTGDAVATAVLA